MKTGGVHELDYITTLLEPIDWRYNTRKALAHGVGEIEMHGLLWCGKSKNKSFEHSAHETVWCSPRRWWKLVP